MTGKKNKTKPKKHFFFFLTKNLNPRQQMIRVPNFRGKNAEGIRRGLGEAPKEGEAFEMGGNGKRTFQMEDKE